LPRFAGLRLNSDWGLSSEVELLSPALLEHAAASGASIAFTPTIAVSDPLRDPQVGYARFKLISYGDEGVLALTRPLSSSLDEVSRLLAVMRGLGIARVLSVAAGNLKDALALIDALASGVDAVEFDVGLSCLLAGEDVAYVRELAGELSATLSAPLILKLSAAGANLINVAKTAADVNAAAIVLTPNVVYKIGRHFFRLHSAHMYPALLFSVAESLAAMDVSVAYVTRAEQEPLASLMPLRLLDVTYVLQWLGYATPRARSSIPLSWRGVSKSLRVYARAGARYCPYGLIRGEGFVEGCNLCGACFELNEPGLVELAALLTPSDSGGGP